MDFGTIIIAGLLVLVIVVLLGWLVSMIRKVGPNEALIITGIGSHPKVIKAGGAIVIPLVQQFRTLSLELMSFDVAPTQDLYTRQGVAVTVEAVAQIKVKSDPESILTAAEQFLNKSPLEREALIRLVMEGHLRGIVGQLSVEEIVKQPEMVADKMRLTSADDMTKMGLEIIAFAIKEVRDKNEYIQNMGKPDIAAIKRNADIAAAEANRDTAIRTSMAQRESAVARALADQERVIAETASATQQAAAVRDLNIAQADYAATVKKQQATSDKAYEIEANVQQQVVVREQVAVERVAREEQVKVQDAEILRKERELVATVLKQAEVERQRVETLAAAERQRRILEAQGQAEAVRLNGAGQADATRLQGMAEADIIRARGQAEADAMHVRADAFKNYNQAAIVDKLISSMPEVIAAISKPLSQVDRITIVSTGGGEGHSLGASQITNDITRIVAQFPALFETLTGMKMSDLMAGVPGLTLTGTNGTNGTVPTAVPVSNGSTPHAIVDSTGRPVES